MLGLNVQQWTNIDAANARSKCTIYGQIFETKAVRSNPIRPIHVVHMCS